MQVCIKCGNKGEKMIISMEGLCPACEILHNSENKLNPKEEIAAQEFSKSDTIKDGILMLVPVIIIVILILSFF